MSPPPASSPPAAPIPSPAPPPVLLASASPRRRELLRRCGYGVQVRPAAVDESRRADETPERYVTRLAVAKAEAARRAPASAERESVVVAADAVVVAADTVVVHEGRILGKPAHEDQARAFLRLLAGSWHEVLTGFCVAGPGERVAGALARTRVRFKSLREAEIAWYVDTGEGRDKAGGYGIQGYGAFLVRRLEGSYTNVVGLPLAEVVDALLDRGVRPAGLPPAEREEEIIR
jgi:septum formation protein